MKIRYGSSALLLKGAALMTVFSMINKLAGVFLRLFTASRMGSEGIGLYQLIMSVYTLFATLATAGFTVSVSRLFAEKAETNRSNSALLLKCALFASAAIGLLISALLFFFSDILAFSVLGDERTAFPLKILAISMPFMSLSSCLKGRFLAVRQVIKTSVAALFEQAVKLSVIVLFLSVFMAAVEDIGLLCTGIVCGVCAGEALSFLLLWLLYIFAKNRVRKSEFLPTQTRSDCMRELISVTMPIGFSVCLTSLLHTAENLLIPVMFEKFNGDRALSLSQFGMIRGMVIPILFFPFAFLGSLVSLLIPEISRLNVRENKAARNKKIASVMEPTFVFSIAAGFLFLFLPNEIGEAFYKGENTSLAIALLATVTPCMYIETVTDGILKAIGEQMHTLYYSIANSALRIAVILAFIPLFGEMGYIFLLIGSNTFAFLLCFLRLKKVTGYKQSIKSSLLLPVLISVFAGMGAKLLIFVLKLAPSTVSAALGSAVYCIIFVCGFFLFLKEKKA